jgi:hypothetical protein
MVTFRPRSAHARAVKRPIIPEPITETFLFGPTAFAASSADSTPQAGANEIPAPPCP